MEEVEIDGGANTSRLRNGHGCKCMCGKGLKLKLGPENLKKLRKGGLRVLKLSGEEREANHDNEALHKGGRRRVAGAGPKKKRKVEKAAKPTQPAGKLVCDPADTSGTKYVYTDKEKIERCGACGLPEEDCRIMREMEGGKLPQGLQITSGVMERGRNKKEPPVRLPKGDPFAIQKIVAKGGSLRGFAKSITHAVDKADKELRDLGSDARKKMGFTKKKFRDTIKGTMEGMGMEDRKSMAADMEGGKFSLYRNDWGLGSVGKRLNESWKKHFNKGMDAADRKIDRGIEKLDGAGLVYGQGKKKKGGPLSKDERTDRQKRAARREAEKEAGFAAPAAKAKKAAPAAKAKKAAPQKAPRFLSAPTEMPNDGPPETLKDPLAWATKGVPNKCGSTEKGQKVLRADSARELASKAASYLTKCPRNPERMEKRSAAIEKYNDKIRNEARGGGLVYGNGLTYGQPVMRGGSIGSRLMTPTNIGSGGNLLAPSNPAMRSQAHDAKWSAFRQMPVQNQPGGMFSTK